MKVFAAAALVAATLSAGAVNAAMEDPCPVDTLARTDFLKPPDEIACILCSNTTDTCTSSCAYDSNADPATTCTVSPEGCGVVVCPEPFEPPVNPDGCPTTKPERDDECDFEGVDCSYPETYDQYCFFVCESTQDGTKRVMEACMGAPMFPPDECSAFTNCADCLGADGCDAWSVGECFDSCDSAPQDTSCWSQQFQDGTSQDICDLAETNEADVRFCAAQTNCESCLDAQLSSLGPEGGCEWFAGGYCTFGCGQTGCGVSVCPGDDKIIGSPNPASVFCEDNGGTEETRTEEAGEYGVCVFDDGSECDSFAFFNEECFPGDSLEEDTSSADCAAHCVEDATGASYRAGDSFLGSDGCNTCKCSENGAIGCTKKFCLADCVTEAYVAPWGVVPVSVGVGDSFVCPDGCNTCTCGENGTIISTFMLCVPECSTDDECATATRSSRPTQTDPTGVEVCQCYGTSTATPFDECEGEDENTCMAANCTAGACECKEAVCDSGLCVLVNELTPAEQASEPSVLPECSAMTTCLDCLDQEGCGAWSVGECYASCNDGPQDVSCWSQEYINGTPEAICMQADNDEADNELCSAQGDCESCMSATTSDDANNCQWFEDGDGYCSNGCGMDGCDVDSCSAATPASGGEEIGTESLTPGGPMTLPEDESMGDCGIEVTVGCVMDGDEGPTQIDCNDYVPTDGNGCMRSVRWTYTAKVTSPPAAAKFVHALRYRDGSYFENTPPDDPHGNPRAYMEDSVGEVLATMPGAWHKLDTWEGENPYNFCAAGSYYTEFEYSTDGGDLGSACVITDEYTLTTSDQPFTPTPNAMSAEGGTPSDGGDRTESSIKQMDSSSASTIDVFLLSVSSIFAVVVRLLVMA